MSIPQRNITLDKQSNHKYEIIVIEDNKDLNRLITTNLENEHFVAKSAFKGAEGLQKISGNGHEILLIDYDLPDTNARKLILKLRAQKIQVPFIVITGHGDEKIAVEMMKLGAADYIIKDNNFIELLLSRIKKTVSELRYKENLEQTQERLEKSEELKKALFKGSTDPILITDLEDNVLDINPAFEDLFGYTLEELKGRTFPGHKGFDKDLFPKWREACRTGTGISGYETERKAKEGSVIPVSMSISPIKDSQGRLEALSFWYRDISDRKHSEEQLKQSEKDYRELFEGAHDAILIFEPENETVLNVNHRACEMYGLDRSEFIGMSLEKISRNIPLGKEKIKKTLQNGSYRHFQTVQRSKNGDDLFLEINASVIEYQGQKAILSLNRDLTARKEAEKKLKESENKFRSLVEQAAEMLFLHDTNGKILDINKAAEENTGYSREELLGMQIADIDPGARQRKDIEKYWKEISLEDAPQTFESQHQRKDGSVYPVEVTLSKVVLADGTHILSLARNITRRKQAEEKLKKSKEKYRTVFENTGTATIIIEADKTISLVNKEFEELSGYSKQEIEGKLSWTKFVAPDDQERMVKYHKKRRKTNKNVPNRYEFKFTDKQNKTHYAIIIVDMIPNTQKSVASFLDITKRKQMEHKLRESENKFRSLVQQAAEMLFLHETDGTIVDVNRAAEINTGYSRQELLGMNIHDIDPDAKQRKDRTKYWSNSKLQETAKIIETRHQRKDGTIYPAEVTLSRVNLTDGNYILALARNTSERKRREREYQQLINGMNDTAFVIDFDGNFIEVNATAVRELGYTREELLNMGPTDLDPYLESSEIENLIQNLPKDKRQVFETRHETKDGEIIPIEISSSLITYQGKEAVLSIARDISKRKKVEEEREKLQDQLLQTQKLESIGTLAGGVAHDFNNILTVIIGLSQLVLSRTEKTDPNYSNLESILNSAERAADLTRQLLLFSRKQDMDFEIINLNDVVSQLRKMLDRLISEDIKMHNDFTYGLWKIKADKSQIEQVIINLVVNARDAMSSGGDLTISTKNVVIDEAKAKTISDIEPGHYVHLDVEDTGRGIDKDIMDNIFDPFFTTKGRAKGTGMGLSVVHGIIKKHHGLIDVHSVPGEGTRFKIYFPVAEEKAKDQVKEDTNNFDNYKGQGETILIVEDEESFLNYLKTTLDAYGYNLYYTQSSTAAKKIFKAEKDHIDLMLSDVVMPEGNGIDLADELTKEKDDLKIILSSGYSNHKVNPSKIRAKGYKYIHKPYGVLKILKLLKSTLQN